jgi:malate dehydrogenase
MKISVIGAAGNIGSCAACNIAIHGVADEVVMIDDYSPDGLDQYASDLLSAVTGLDVEVRKGSYEDMYGSDIIIMAAGSAKIVSSRQEVLPQNLPLVVEMADRIRQCCPETVVITATNPVCPLDYAMQRRTGFDRKKVLGYSANDSIRFRMFVAQALGVASSRVNGTVIGEHGDSQVLLFSSVRVDGEPVSISTDVKEWVRRQVAGVPKILEEQRVKTGRTATWTTSMGIADMCRAIANDTGYVIPCSMPLEGEYGYHGMGMSVPVVLGSGGVREVLELDLEPDESEELEHSVEAIRPMVAYVDEYLKNHAPQSIYKGLSYE